MLQPNIQRADAESPPLSDLKSRNLSGSSHSFSLGYLKPRYALRMGTKELSELSPGERGIALGLLPAC